MFYSNVLALFKALITSGEYWAIKRNIIKCYYKVKINFQSNKTNL